MLYDLSLIGQMGKNDPSFIGPVVGLFLASIPTDLSELNEAYVEKNWKQFALAAHKLKSTIDTLGIGSISETIRTIETATTTNEFDEKALGLQVNKITSILNEVHQELSEKYPQGI